MTAPPAAGDVPGAILRFRTTPPWLVGRAVRVVERNAVANRRAWTVFLSGLLEPVLYLFAIGAGLGGLVGEVVGPDGTPVSYGAFVAPAMLAASAMNGAVFESTFNVFSKLKWGHTYDAMLATPLSPRDVAVGELSWSLLRGALYAAGFLLVAWLAGFVTSPWALLAVPVAVLVGFGFAGLGLVATTFMKSWQDFDLVTMALMPMFLFSATFFPLEVYPPALRPIVALSPLTHGVELTRGVMLGVVHPGLLGHAAVFVVLGAIGLRVASRRFATLLQR